MRCLIPTLLAVTCLLPACAQDIPSLDRFAAVTAYGADGQGDGGVSQDGMRRAPEDTEGATDTADAQDSTTIEAADVAQQDSADAQAVDTQTVDVQAVDAADAAPQIDAVDSASPLDQEGQDVKDNDIAQTAPDVQPDIAAPDVKPDTAPSPDISTPDVQPDVPAQPEVAPPECKTSIDCASKWTLQETGTCLLPACFQGICTLLPLPDTSPCTDGNAGTVNDVCTAGVCKGAIPPPPKCAELPACNTSGLCSQGPNNTCIADAGSCKKSTGCAALGLCTLGDNDTCIAVGADCTNTPLCVKKGYCLADNGICVYNCGPPTGVCTGIGKCTFKALSCPACKDAPESCYALCPFVTENCVAATDAECAKSGSCLGASECSVDAVAGICIIKSDADCVKGNDCAKHGQCKFSNTPGPHSVDYSCIAKSNADCQQSADCKNPALKFCTASAAGTCVK